MSFIHHLTMQNQSQTKDPEKIFRKTDPEKMFRKIDPEIFRMKNWDKISLKKNSLKKVTFQTIK